MTGWTHINITPRTHHRVSREGGARCEYGGFMSKPDKPLGHKNYGSIGHLPGSKLGPGDHTINDGMTRILTETGRNANGSKVYTITAEEKYDGANVGIARIGSDIVALGRAGYPADTSPYEQFHWFAHWVDQRASLFRELLDDGERLCGEWMAVAHGIRYEIPDEPFVPFDLMRRHKRVLREEFLDRVRALRSHGIWCPRFVAATDQGLPPQRVMQLLSETHSDSAAAIPSGSRHEGLVYRAERDGQVCFLAKWVRQDFEPGAMLPGIGRTDDADPIINQGAGHVVLAN